MMPERIRHIAIVGGGLTAWSTAAVLARQLKGHEIQITVIAGTCETLAGSSSMLPSCHDFHRMCGLDDTSLLRLAGASWKLGNAYTDWSGPGTNFMHSYSPAGEMLEAVDFHHYLVRLRKKGQVVDPEQFSIAAIAARAGRIGDPRRDSQPPAGRLPFAYHVGREEYRKLLRDTAQSNGVRCFDARVVNVKRSENDAFITSLALSDGEQLTADFYFDCSGPDASLLNSERATDYESWNKYLPCDRIVGAVTESSVSNLAHTEFQRSSDGWQRIIPLADTINRQFHYSSLLLDDDTAIAKFGEPDPGASQARLYFEIRNPGRQKRFWRGNCVALGSAAGHAGELVVPEEHLAQSAILRWLRLFPDADCNKNVVGEYNRTTGEEYERVLDANSLPYLVASRHDSPFWQGLCDVDWPQSLIHRLDLFRQVGKLAFYESEPFSAQLWISLLLGMEIWPAHYDSLADDVETKRLIEYLDRYRVRIQGAVEALPTLEVAMARVKSAAMVSGEQEGY